MESRMEKYYKQDLTDYKRTTKNTRLYEEVYGNYSQLENLPIPDNTNEIDITKLKALIENREDYQKTKALHPDQDIKSTFNNRMTEEELRKQEQKIYDINKLLEKAKNDNAKLKEASEKLIDTNYNFLATLESNQLMVEEIKEAKEKITPPLPPKEEEIKYQTKRINNDPTVDQIINTSTLPLDLLSDLKPNNENTIVTAPIKEDQDVPIEKPILTTPKEEVNENTASFYSDSYSFSKKDFEGAMSDDFLDIKPSKSSYFFKILFLIIGLSICGTIIYFFIKYYGIGV